ncbi:hypothetical protein HPHPH16_0114 [Helicobacter pylori Hp H-16]|nr:hypothetical protein HPHPH16_0114 [Helicobacter pylori Hp H-16]
MKTGILSFLRSLKELEKNCNVLKLYHLKGGKSSLFILLDLLQ